MQDTYLVHFGILGQKWGKRNGPPYPLGSDQKSAKEKSMARMTVGGFDGQSNKSVSLSSKDAQSAKEIADRAGKVTRKVGEKQKDPVKKQTLEEAKTLSDEELQKEINRMQKEIQYSDLKSKEIQTAADTGKWTIYEKLDVALDVAVIGLSAAALIMKIKGK